MSEDKEEEKPFLPDDNDARASNNSSDTGSGPYSLWWESQWDRNLTLYISLVAMGGLLMGMILMGV